MILYIILGEEWLRGRKIEDLAVRIAASGASMIQLRENKDAEEIIDDAKRVITALKDYNVSLFINNRPDIALEVDAHGVHIGQKDIPISTARKILGRGKKIGVSAHSVQEAVRAQNEGADYISFGSVFPSRTKKSQVRSLKTLAEIKRRLEIPLFAIGGITLQKIQPIVRHGVDGICVSRDILDRDDIEERIKSYLKVLGAS